MIILKKIMFFSLILYSLSLVLFDREGYITYLYYSNLFVFFSFILFKFKTIRLFEYKINNTLYIYLIFIIFCMFSLFWSISFEIGALRVTTLLLVFLNMIVIYNILSILDSYNSIFIGLFIGTFINFLIVIGVFHNSLDYYQGWRFVGTTGNANIISTYMVISILASIIYLSTNIKMKLFYYFQYFNISISFYIVIMTGSKKGIILAILFILFYLLGQLTNPKKQLKMILQITIISIIIFYFFVSYIDLTEMNEMIGKTTKRFLDFANGEGQSTKTRIELALFAFENFSNNPLLGTGIGSFLYKYNTYAHNNYLELLSEVGIIGFSLYYLLYLKLIYKTFTLNIKLDQKIPLFSFIFLFLLFDFAEVNYYSKFILFYLVLLIYMIERIEKNENTSNYT